jgi:hypothetical protein
MQKIGESMMKTQSQEPPKEGGSNNEDKKDDGQGGNEGNVRDAETK